MKKSLSLRLFVFFLLIIIAGDYPAMSKSKNNSDEKRLSQLMKQYGEPHLKDNKYLVWYPLYDNVIYFSKIDSTLLTEEEKMLLKSFKDVIYSDLTSPFYFLIDEYDRVGVYKISEKSLWIPPIDGAITIWSNNIYAGSHMSYEDWEQIFQLISTSYPKYPIGDFGAAIYNKIKVHLSSEVDYMESRLAIPAGKYDGIKAVCDGLDTKSFIVAKFDNENNLLWGVTDADGKESVECKYSAIIRENGKYVGTNNCTMTESVNNERYRLERKRARYDHFDSVIDKIANVAEAAAPYLMVVGTAMQTAAEYIPSSGDASYSDSDSEISSSSSSGTSASLSSGDKHSASEVSSKNNAMNIYSNYENQLSKMKTYPETYNDMQRRDIQSKMRNIRQQWESKGYSMRKSQWEDWSGL